MISFKALKSTLVVACKLILALLDPNHKDNVSSDIDSLKIETKDLKKDTDQLSKDAEIQYLRQKADVLEAMLRQEIEKNMKQQLSLKAPPPAKAE